MLGLIWAAFVDVNEVVEESEKAVDEIFKLWEEPENEQPASKKV